MARQGISTGTIPNDGTGDTLLSGAIKINQNFSEVYGLIGDGTNAYVGIVTQIVAGSNISISTSYGSVTVTSTASGGGGESYWTQTDVGIHTLSNVGIGTTNSTSRLTVGGDAKVSGAVTATSFVGDGSGLTNIPAGQLTGILPVLDGSNLFGVTASGTGIIVKDDGSTVGTAGTIDFGSNLSVTFASGIATVTASIAGINTSGTSTFNELSISGVSTFSGAIDANSTSNFQGDVTLQSNLILGDNDQIELGAGTDLLITHLSSSNNSLIRNSNTLGSFIIDTAAGSPIELRLSSGGEKMGVFTPNGSVDFYYDNSKKFETTGGGVSITGGVVATGVITASSFSGSNTLKERSIVTGVTTSIANNGIGNTDISGFKSYALLKVGISTAGWLRLYTDSASRDADVVRSVGEDPTPGSGVIAEVVTTGISTTQIISPFVIGGNLDNPADTTIYASIKNLSGSTQAITANLTILQLEA